MADNTLYYGDNLDILRRYVPDASVDLVYLDPPFNSNATYNVLFGDAKGHRSDAQIKAFDDTWHWDHAAAAALDDVLAYGGQPAAAMSAFQTLLGHGDMLAYLSMMAPRLIELRRVLKPTGSIYLHCDPTASHYLKVLMDAVFGPECFQNEIIWKRSSAHSDAKQGAKHFGRVSDTILFYAKGDDRPWHTIYQEYDESYVERDYRRIEEETGRRYRLSDMSGPGGAAKGNPYYEVMGVWRHWRFTEERMRELIAQGRVVQTRPGAVPQYKRYLDEMPGVPLQNIWADVPVINNRSSEKLGYPTQKPLALLERIIAASSNPSDLVLDPFCGCGTAVVAAQRLGRRWIGIDITVLAVNLMKTRLRDTFGPDLAFKVIGEPTTVDDAQALADSDNPNDKYQFQIWALGLVDARPDELKKGADKGIDGRRYFRDSEKGPAQHIVFSVKAGKLHATYVRDLVGVVNRDGAAIGVLVSMQEPTRPMREEAAAAGFYLSPLGTKHRRIQLLTVGELLAGKVVDLPRAGIDLTYRQAPRELRRVAEEQAEMDFGDDDEL